MKFGGDNCTLAYFPKCILISRENAVNWQSLINDNHSGFMQKSKASSLLEEEEKIVDAVARTT